VGDPEVCSSVDPVGGGDLVAFFAEMSRLVSEAQSRAESGEMLPALSSLAALPQVHRMVVDHCGLLLAEPVSDEGDDPEVTYGLYL
jgi:hypothetical protein